MEVRPIFQIARLSPSYLLICTDLAELGWAIALHSAGTIVTSPLLIAWSRRRTIREVLVGSLIVMIAGGILHGMARNITMLLVARFVIGSGSANYVITAKYLVSFCVIICFFDF
jgi:predicted MFS family arabinose efflux permease